MEATSDFTLEQHTAPYEQWPLLTRLFHQGRDTGTRVPGYVIEAEYRCAQGWLLILSHDCPFEEASDFVLLDPAFRVLARRCLSVPYGSFQIEAHQPDGDDALLLRYDGDLCYRLSIRRGWLWGWSLRLRACPESLHRIAAVPVDTEV